MKNLPILTARIVHCQFEDSARGRGYAYFTEDQTIKEGDYVLVVSPNGPGVALGDFGYPKVVRVSSVEETVEGVNKVKEWIISKLDFSGYAERRAQEEQRQVLRAKIERAVREAKNNLDLSDLAARSPELKALLDQLAAI